MKNIVTWLTAIILILVGLYFLGVHLPLLNWIDTWDESIAIAVRSGLSAAVIVLYTLSMRELTEDNS